MATLQQATKTNSYEMFKKYSKHVDDMNKGISIRGLLNFKVDKSKVIRYTIVDCLRRPF
jgi:hypothetical protein